jgi:GT2 family glycosyltransferase
MGIIKVIAVAYQRPVPLQTLCNSFIVQTSPDWELVIVHDGPAPDDVRVGVPKHEKILFLESNERNGFYGHPNRRKMLQDIPAGADDYILITNDDNYYVPTYVKFMLSSAVGKPGLIYCDTVHSYFGHDVLKSRLKKDFIDMGAFIVRADVAKAVGFNSDDYAADGIYCEECVSYCQAHGLGTVYLPKPLFVHN